MADESNKVVTEARESFGKGAARKIRAAGKIPAVVYGHGTDPIHVTVPAHQVGLLLRKANAVLDLDIAGKSQLVLVKDVQKDPVLQIIEHLDLIVIRSGEKVSVEVPVHVEGDTYPGTIAMLDVPTLRLEVEATHIPERIVLDVTDAEEGTQFHAKDFVLPKGAALAEDPELLILNVIVPASSRADEEADAAVAEAASAASAAAAAESDAE
ncbi:MULTISPECIES: 50S ribosomal protein L25/general stress protein Ctc [unclassified Leifsonia]|uniref:50S ribosomal protein L25/general stress protein Ctc n=1 Tax=unclassified Leifsonia TaxID=2663824 RepID=UPI000A1958DF|nr:MULTISPECIES: 50S ribosomal protein L25/general stress protein Ctc [unclassified Leifsonia]QIZ99304.1 50S ribosomal protein L25/general stress protein Ctc [Leifsonia sp. PS1209]